MNQKERKRAGESVCGRGRETYRDNRMRGRGYAECYTVTARLTLYQNRQRCHHVFYCFTHCVRQKQEKVSRNYNCNQHPCSRVILFVGIIFQNIAVWM